MAITADDLRDGISDAKEARRIVALYLSGWLLIVAGAVFGDMDAHGVTVMILGGLLIFAALVGPWIVRIIEAAAERGRTRFQEAKLTAELADIESAWQAGLAERDRRFTEQLAEQDRSFAAKLGDLHEAVVGIRGQLR